jgi:hypothetical protein
LNLKLGEDSIHPQCGSVRECSVFNRLGAPIFDRRAEGKGVFIAASRWSIFEYVTPGGS